MNKIDLTKLITPGGSVFSAMHGHYIAVIGIDETQPFPIITPDASFTKYGSWMVGGDCMIFPSRENRSWENPVASNPYAAFA